ncbi:MAG: ergothioneine biosynthesis protein EgtC [Halothece sp.]
MCRLLGYLGSTVQIDELLCQPSHSLVVQAYQPKEMESALMNADGFGLGWFHPEKETFPYIYKHTMPIWGDINLPQISRYVEAACWLGYVRSATPGLAVDLSNCQPFSSEGLSLSPPLLFTHNGYINQFRKTLYRPLRLSLSNDVYLHIHGTTDSEHIFALILNQLYTQPKLSLVQAVETALNQLADIAQAEGEIYFCANVMVSDGKQLVATRFASRSPAPTLYWLENDPNYPEAVIIASEPLFEGNWKRCPEQSIISVGEDGKVYTNQITPPCYL